MKSITLDLDGYYITGIADISLWGGGNACIKMTPFKVGSIKEIPDNINDAEFGVESINGAVCDIYRDYQGSHRYSRTVIIGNVSKGVCNMAGVKGKGK